MQFLSEGRYVASVVNEKVTFYGRHTGSGNERKRITNRTSPARNSSLVVVEEQQTNLPLRSNRNTMAAFKAPTEAGCCLSHKAPQPKFLRRFKVFLDTRIVCLSD